MIGKEIVRFHCGVLACISDGGRAGAAQDDRGARWLLFEESKMSKSRGKHRAHRRQSSTCLVPMRWRYFLLREVVFGQDDPFLRRAGPALQLRPGMAWAIWPADVNHD